MGRNKHLKSFKLSDKWYRGAAVDKLSIEEAAVIAQTIITALEALGLITEEVREPMKADLEAHYERELLAIESAKDLYDRQLYKRSKNALKTIVENYLGEGNMPDLQMGSSSNTCKKGRSKSCCKGKSEKSCCSHKQKQ